MTATDPATYLPNGGIKVMLGPVESIAIEPVDDTFQYVTVALREHSGQSAIVTLDIGDQEYLGKYLLDHAATARNREAFEKGRAPGTCWR